MGLAGGGTSTVEVLRAKAAPRNRERNFDQILYDFTKNEDPRRIPALEKQFDELMRSVQHDLFDRSKDTETDPAASV